MFGAQLLAWLVAHHRAHLAALLQAPGFARVIAWALRHGFTYQP